MQIITNKLLIHLFHKVSQKKDKITLENKYTGESVILPIQASSSKKERSYYILTAEKKYAPFSFCSWFVKAYKIESFFLKKMGQQKYNQLHNFITTPIINYISKVDYFKINIKDFPADLQKLCMTISKQYYESITQKQDYSFTFLSKDPRAIEFLNSIAKKTPLIKNNYTYIAYKINSESSRTEVIKTIEESFLENENNHKYNISYKL